MAPGKLNQVKFASGSGKAWPPFPGGWAVCFMRAVLAYDPAVSLLPGAPSPRTWSRLLDAEAITERTMRRLHAELVHIARQALPNLGASASFAGYVEETFGAYLANSCTYADQWVRAFATPRAPMTVLGRCLFRDLVLRLTYLELCERCLAGMHVDPIDVELLHGGDPTRSVARVMDRACKVRGCSREGLAFSLGIGDRQLRRGIRGTAHLTRKQLQAASEGTQLGHRRTILGIGFVRALLKEFEAELGPLQAGLGESVSTLFSRLVPRLREGAFHVYSRREDRMVNTTGLAGFVHHKASLLLHPGLEELVAGMPSALWRAHLYGLRFGRFKELCESYLKHSELETDQAVERYWTDYEEAAGPRAWQW